MQRSELSENHGILNLSYYQNNKLKIPKGVALCGTFFGFLKALDKTFIYEYNSNGNVTRAIIPIVNIYNIFQYIVYY